MRSGLFLAAALCLVALAAGAQIEYVMYTDDACTTGATSVQTIQSGTCSTTGNGESYSTYCSSDASTLFQVSFADTACTAAKAYQVAAQDTTCGFSANKMLVKCTNTTSGPFAPVTPATAGFATATQCSNSTDNYHGANSCSASGANVKCSTIGFAAGFCKTTGNLPMGTLSGASGCSPDQTLRGSAFFSDNACATPVMWVMQEAECADGLVMNGCGGASVPTLPSKGVISFAGANSAECSDDYKNPSSATFYADGCVNSKEFSCATVNGTTTVGTLKTYADSTNSGKCTTLVSTVSQAEGVCVDGTVFFCNYTPKSAAASVQISFVAMIVAALVALVAARS